MPQILSHYDTLQVSRDASVEVIRAAYKRLARDHHPDRNRNSAESHRMMQSLNAAFEVLTDSSRRARYDDWLDKEERAAARLLRSFADFGPKLTRLTDETQELAESFVEGVKRFSAVWLAPIALVLFLVWTLFVTRESMPRPDSDQPPAVYASANPLPAAAPYEAPRTAPNGTPWPMQAADISGYPVGHNDGKSVVTIDNSRNAADVFVKLVSLENEMAVPVRHVYVPAFGTFECKNVRKGKYELRYQDLSNGGVNRSDVFELAETRTDRAVNYSVMKVTLFKITDGQSAANGLSAAEF